MIEYQTMFEATLVQSDLRERIINAIISNRFPHAVFIKSSEGGGALPLAIAIAHEILVNKAPNNVFEDTRALRLEHPDLHMVFPIQQLQSKNQLTSAPFINDFREYYKERPYMTFQEWLMYIGQEDKTPIISVYEAEAIIKKLSLKSYEGGNQVMIIWKPELMNLDCANKLLKIIEEPEPGNIIIMVGDKWENMIPTIRSRTQLINLKPFTDPELHNWLENTLNISGATAENIIANAEGNPGRAASIIKEEELNSDLEELCENWILYTKAYDRTSLISWVDEVSRLSKNDKLRLLRILLENISSNHFSIGSHKKLDNLKIEKMSEQIENAIYKLYRNAYSKTLFLSMSLQACKIFNYKSS